MNAVQPVRRFCFPRAALLRHMRFWSRFVKIVREDDIDHLPPRLRTYIRAHQSEVNMYLCCLERNGNLFPRDQRRKFLKFLKKVYLSPVEPPPPNPIQRNPHANQWDCVHCGTKHRLDRTYKRDDWIEYINGLGEEGVDQMEFPHEDYE